MESGALLWGEETLRRRQNPSEITMIMNTATLESEWVFTSHTFV